MRKIRWFVLVLLSLLLLLTLGAWLYAGMYGVNILYRHGGTIWLPVARDSERLSPAMRLALSSTPRPVPPTLSWHSIAPGFEVAEMQARAGGKVVDTVHLARIDSARYRFSVHNDASGHRNLDRWMQDLGAALVVNGSYFEIGGKPATPLLSGGRLLGPRQYDARAGAFVATASGAGIHDLSTRQWRHVFRNASDAMVSYPLLLSERGKEVKTKSEWLANRSFVAEDLQGRIVIGTTTDAYFSLSRFADFLMASPLQLRIALNLDGGPVACQGINLAGYRRTTYGNWEAQVDGKRVSLLTRPYGGADPMPIVLAVFPR